MPDPISRIEAVRIAHERVLAASKGFYDGRYEAVRDARRAFDDALSSLGTALEDVVADLARRDAVIETYQTQLDRIEAHAATLSKFKEGG